MAARQRIFRVRRDYNQWVANQTLEDYALRFTAKSARRWSEFRVANTALGSISFLALEAIGGTITLSYGFQNAALAILLVGALIFAAGLPIAYYAARYGVDIDLLTRGAGFGYIGSTITSLVYASFTFIFFAIEAVIMAAALEMSFGVPQPVGYLISSVVVIPMVAHGITFISRFQLWTQAAWTVLQLLPFVVIALVNRQVLDSWTAFAGHAGDGGFRLLQFGAAASVVFSLVAQIGEQVDFLRFLPPLTRTNRVRWWIAMVAAGPGWTVLGVLKLLAGSLLAVLALQHGMGTEQAAQPSWMYRVAFEYLIPSPGAALVLAGIFIVVSQLKINLTNSYAGSIAWSNFFSRITHRHPGRVVWLVFNVAIALLLMEFGVYGALERILGFYASVAAAWQGALVADLVVNKPLGLSPRYIEFKRAHLYDINPVGFGAMLLATLLAAASYSGLLGETVQVFTPFAAFAAAFLLAPAIAVATGGRFYIARKPRRGWQKNGPMQCCLCENEFEPEDMAWCPVYGGAICSLCCSLDARCNDGCAPASRIDQQLRGLLQAVLPPTVVARLESQLGQYVTALLLMAGAAGAILALLYYQSPYDLPAQREALQAEFLKIFFLLALICGVGAWITVLARENRRMAQDESRMQTALLQREINAHKRTDAALQKAKETAESANQAKSRYVVGISHELRTPLNAILGYAQLLERDQDIAPRWRDAAHVIRRSGDHLASLIEGLLDISRIETGKLHLRRDEVQLAEFLDQIVAMVRLQAQAKGIELRFERPDDLPVAVHTDEKRLRQILINLFSNAIKFTERGFVALRVRYRSEVAEFEIEDSGIGIGEADLRRIFDPFERVQAPGQPAQPGIGLGLTITRLLTEIMGGEVTVRSIPGKGSVFKVRVLLSRVAQPLAVPVPGLPIRGYGGPRRLVVVADDDAAHCDLMQQILTPLGFTLLLAADGAACLALARDHQPDLFLLDVQMPGLDGWNLVRALRRTGHRRAAIIMISANAGEANHSKAEAADGDGEPMRLHDGYLIKPIEISALLDRIRVLLDLDWIYDDPSLAAPTPTPPDEPAADVPRRHLDDLTRLGRMGYLRGIRDKLDALEREEPGLQAFVTRMRTLVGNLDMGGYMALLNDLRGEAALEREESR